MRQTHLYGREHAPERFWMKVDKGGPVHPTIGTECWAWTGCRIRGGYGRFSPVRSDTMYAHRYAYFLAHGDIPDGLYVLHRCDNKWCVRADHLFLGTYKDNTQDMIAKGREPACMKAQVVCKNGHKMADHAIPIRINGKPFRRCGACKATYQREYARRNRDRLRIYFREYDKRRAATQKRGA